MSNSTLLLALALVACALHSEADDLEAGRLGGAATTADDGINAFSYPSPTLDRMERRAFSVGNAFFKDNWVTAPASASARDGLGPLFNARSCSSCHLRDGRGAPPDSGLVEEPGLLIRIGVRADGGDLPHPAYGGQIQDHAVLGLAPEARVRIRHETLTGSFADGTTYELAKPVYVLEELAYGPLGDDAVLGPRVAGHMVGLGLLEAIPADALLAQEDPNDVDGDGVSGRAHRVTSLRTGEPAIGRFGWKATQPTVEEQVAAAFVNDIGITSPLQPREVVRPAQAERFEVVSGGSPELDERKLQRVTFYSQTLAVPAQRDASSPAVRAGRAQFDALGCAACHTPTWTTGDEAVTSGYRNQTIHPFSDLLLHDLGPELADEKHDGEATPAEWRTPPLWGIGLFEVVNGHTRYLHDGRARTLEEAVLWHGGEALASRDAYLALAREQREALLAFLRSL